MIDWDKLKSMGPRERVGAFTPLIRDLIGRCTGEALLGARSLSADLLGDPTFTPSRSQLLAGADSVWATEDEGDFDGNTLAGLVLFLAIRLLPDDDRAALVEDERIGPCLLDDDTVFDALIASDEIDDPVLDGLR